MWEEWATGPPHLSEDVEDDEDDEYEDEDMGDA